MKDWLREKLVDFAIWLLKMTTPYKDRCLSKRLYCLANTYDPKSTYGKMLDALTLAENYLVERGIEHKGVTGRTIVLPAIREAITSVDSIFT